MIGSYGYDLSYRGWVGGVEYMEDWGVWCGVFGVDWGVEVV